MNENYITCRLEKGSINISEDVISGIVRTAILEVDGVSCLSNTAGSEIAELVGIKAFNRGIKVHFEETQVTVDCVITVCYGQNIMQVAANVQESVISVVQSATGMENVIANVHVSGIAFDK